MEFGIVKEHEQNLVGISWLSRVRYFALVCYGALVLLGGFYLNISTNYLLISAALFALLVNNLVSVRVGSLSGAWSEKTKKILGVSILLDILFVGLILLLTGGYLNPFSTMLLLYVFLAASVLRDELWTWISFVTASVTFAVLFTWYHPVPAFGAHHGVGMHHGHQVGFSMHLHGMLLSFILLGMIFSYFFSRLNREQSKVEEQLMVLRDREIDDQRMLGLATLCAGAAHELGTPLGTISLILEELKSKIRFFSDIDFQNNVSSKVKSVFNDLSDIGIELDRITSVLNRMREMPDAVGEEPEYFSLSSIVEELLGRFNNSPDISVNFGSDANSRVKCFREGLLASLSVLINNALQASKNAGGKSASVSLEVKRSSDFFEWCVRDEGIGMSRDQLERAGEPFFTTKEEGMGLGIYIVKSFCRLVGGRLEIISEEGRGTRASLILPQYVM
ncbi:MAG TPA: ATP-binding protein [Oligoflexia bacterium]|nr:ATP-binding protein [Oligoflexia bacterium]HMP49274.1 ATP-binding protein [Oligoflexia bacterium]